MSTLLYDARKRIEDLRKQDVKVVVRRNGSPVQGARIDLKMLGHEFLFGCNNFFAFANDDAANHRFQRYFADLFNYVTLPFYWADYEPQRGQTQGRRLRKLTDWAKDIGAATKGHPIAWQKLSPEWLTNTDDMEALLKARVEGLMAQFGDVDFWDVFNEITVASTYANPMSKWIHHKGKANAVRFVAELVRQVKPDANLIYNDFFIWEKDCEILLDELRHMDTSLQAVGIQSHMHDALWPLENTWEVCERYARFGWPIHFTEFTVLSGRYIGKGKMSDSSVPQDWSHEPEMLELQAQHSVDTYTLLFSHPALEAITWWDFQDGDWRGAPAGVVTEDIHRKPVYHALRKLIREHWWSDKTGQSDGGGQYGARVFRGRYEVEVFDGSQTVRLETDISRAMHTNRNPQVIIVDL